MPKRPEGQKSPAMAAGIETRLWERAAIVGITDEYQTKISNRDSALEWHGRAAFGGSETLLLKVINLYILSIVTNPPLTADGAAVPEAEAERPSPSVPGSDRHGGR